MPSSAETASNWDFTSVLNLLRSPAYNGREQSHLVGHTNVPATFEKDDTKKSASDSDASYPRLGDFGPLWDLLGRGSSPDVKTEQSQAPRATCAEQQKCNPIQILKRPLANAKSAEHTIEQTSRPAPRPILGSNAYEAQLPKKKAVAENSTACQNPQSKASDASSSESSAEAESDGNFSVFDPPLLKNRGAVSFIPLQVCTTASNAEPCDTPPSSFDELDGSLTAETVKSLPTGPIRAQPIAYKSAADRKVGLLTKLLKKFPEYAEAVAQVGRSQSTKSNDQASRPIHVFVDMSNIMVGFHDSVKLARNIPVKTRIRRLPLSFQNFSLILERGRPAAKRVLVGSDRFAAIDESQKLGYEANILNRVHKVKHVTRRQSKYRKNPRVSSQEGGSGSETNDAPEERWVEQGVDEILHLKILESLVDTDEPATIVLATGDAAEAEYSGGFMKMVERALQRGWNVELVSFSQVTSFAYRRKEFRAKWGKQFRFIALDEFSEELLDM
ncbi:hypothetical protein IFM58399_05838 [Aspergillus lentulus]|uniref:NYN domain-containing protein n=1 Tax=Aspergillus lentulus TaxID=293939 RepID=A0ABQ1ARG6_ASPLE|nr:uncharacterized protein IFM58399_05838 [Aspergillus lentulus]GFF40189.1 hypothetical protein IFM58399_05838 [Aspergillus lentulus]GFF60614.1 hypothetical protein IFM62136_04705 [Aspergillus lentulus]GFF83050.1 hypothetical protein IFM47457_06010 [Aspergillus lentulus]GFF86747.1 hypothetical protein IFM60648_07810 [Aspergillus lentulus]GFG07220.1 hypothetical protein IFM61392_04744 [Aspergillus lentulus]